MAGFDTIQYRAVIYAHVHALNKFLISLRIIYERRNLYRILKVETVTLSVFMGCSKVFLQGGCNRLKTTVGNVRKIL